MREALSFDDILLAPECSVLQSRKDADLSTELVSGVELRLPFISANMPSVTGIDLAREMARLGGIGALSRVERTIPEAVYEFLRTSRAADDLGAWNTIVSFGLEDYPERVEELAATGARIFLLDVAHADSLPVYEVVHDFNKGYRQRLSLIVGNVATRSAAVHLADAGVDALKVGIGPGAACVTRGVTGFGVPQITAIQDVAQVLEYNFPHVKVIADGGIRNSGDVVKAIWAGADSVMLGSLLAGADESPDPGVYYGNASAAVNGHNAPEGVEGSVPLSGPLEKTIKSLAWGVRSGISYAGGTKLADIRNAEAVRVTAMAQSESGVRV